MANILQMQQKRQKPGAFWVSWPSPGRGEAKAAHAGAFQFAQKARGSQATAAKACGFVGAGLQVQHNIPGQGTVQIAANDGSHLGKFFASGKKVRNVSFLKITHMDAKCAFKIDYACTNDVLAKAHGTQARVLPAGYGHSPWQTLLYVITACPKQCLQREGKAVGRARMPKKDRDAGKIRVACSCLLLKAGKTKAEQGSLQKRQVGNLDSGVFSRQFGENMDESTES